MSLRALLPCGQGVEHVTSREADLGLQPAVSADGGPDDRDPSVCEGDAGISINAAALESYFSFRRDRHVDLDRAGADRIAMLVRQRAPGEQVAVAVLANDTPRDVGQLESMGAIRDWLEVPFDPQTILAPHTHLAGAVSLRQHPPVHRCFDELDTIGTPRRDDAEYFAEGALGKSKDDGLGDPERSARQHVDPRIETIGVVLLRLDRDGRGRDEQCREQQPG